MGIRKSYYLTCTNCNNQFYDEVARCFGSAETAKEILEYAKSRGWIRKRVPNGTYWDFCTRCQKKFKEEIGSKTDSPPDWMCVGSKCSVVGEGTDEFVVIGMHANGALLEGCGKLFGLVPYKKIRLPGVN